MNDGDRIRRENLRELLAQAECGVIEAERAVLAAADLSVGLVPPLEDEFEFRAAIRSLQAALTALRSLLLDLDRLPGP